MIALNRNSISTVALASNQGLPTALKQAKLMAEALMEDPDGTSIASKLSN